MKTIKTIFALLFVSSMFIACETDTVDGELGLDEGTEILGAEADEEVEEEGEEDILP